MPPPEFQYPKVRLKDCAKYHNPWPANPFQYPKVRLKADYKQALALVVQVSIPEGAIEGKRG